MASAFQSSAFGTGFQVMVPAAQQLPAGPGWAWRLPPYALPQTYRVSVRFLLPTILLVHLWDQLESARRCLRIKVCLFKALLQAQLHGKVCSRGIVPSPDGVLAAQFEGQDQMSQTIRCIMVMQLSDKFTWGAERFRVIQAYEALLGV